MHLSYRKGKRMKAIDVHGFGGGFTLGVVEAGFELAAKMSVAAGFGVYSTLANRHKLGYGWDSLLGTPPVDNVNQAPPAWEVMEADLVFGNPPCSGFSTLSPKAFRGVDSTINQYMWQLIDYAAKVAPPIVIWESVQQTFRQGLKLMRALHDHLEQESGKQYTLYHVLHNNASVGGASIRKRYFWVAVEDGVPFGVDHNRVTREGVIMPPTPAPSLNETLMDLESLGLTMAPQPYRGAEVFHIGHDDQSECTHNCRVWVHHSSEWAQREMHSGSGVVDGHQVFVSPTLARIKELCRLEPWAEGERMSDVMRRYYQRTGTLPSLFEYPTTKVVDGRKVQLLKTERLVETDFAMGHNQPVRWRGDRPAYVITGGGVHLILHPRLDRTLTQREAARIQGFPDDWLIWPIRNVADLGPAWGKGVPVQAGRWIAKWAYEALSGRPGPNSGETLEVYDRKLGAMYGPREREFVVDITDSWKALSPSS